MEKIIFKIDTTKSDTIVKFTANDMLTKGSTIEINHINYSLTWLTPEQCGMFADLGAYLGIYAMDIGRFYTMDDVLDIYKAVGPERIVFGSDCGHIANPHPVDSLRMLILGCLQSGIPDEHIKMMCQTNAYNLLH